MVTTSLALQDPYTWDLLTDSDTGDIAIVSNGDAIAQDVACAIRLFLGELWYATDQGIDYFGLVLGKSYSQSLIIALMNKAALSVPGVAKVKTTITSISARELAGTVEIVDNDNVTHIINF